MIFSSIKLDLGSYIDEITPEQNATEQNTDKIF